MVVLFLFWQIDRFQNGGLQSLVGLMVATEWSDLITLLQWSDDLANHFLCRISLSVKMNWI